MNRVIDNPRISRYLLKFSKQNIDSYDYNDSRVIIRELKNNIKITNLTNDIFIDDDNILGKLKHLDKLDGKEYKKLYDEIIQVGEFKNA